MKQNDIFEVREIKISYIPKKSTFGQKPLCGSDISEKFIRSTFDNSTIGYTESFKVIPLNNSLLPLGVKSIEGGLTCAAVDVRCIMQTLLLANATCAIIAHNHPAGTMKPSQQDKNITRVIADACKIMDMKLIDHLILSPVDGSYFSFTDEGLL